GPTGGARVVRAARPDAERAGGLDAEGRGRTARGRQRQVPERRARARRPGQEHAAVAGVRDGDVVERARRAEARAAGARPGVEALFAESAVWSGSGPIVSVAASLIRLSPMFMV